jgi:subtilisin family serine protease
MVMEEIQVTTGQVAPLPAQPKNRSTAALVFFVLFALLTPLCTLAYHFGLWYLGQLAIASGSFGNFKWGMPIGLTVQGMTVLVVSGALYYFTKDDRFKPIYLGWFIAALMAFPAVILFFVGPNNDQLGSILQTVFCLATAGIVAWVRKRKIEFKRKNMSLAFLLAAFGVAPFAVFGALGSPTDVILDLLAGLSLGLFASLLMESTTGNKFLDALGIGALLALLGSVVGYDGSQLILIALLTPFAFATSTLMPSRPAAGLLVGLLAAAGLTFFDPTELTIVLGDLSQLAIRAGLIALGLGSVVGLIALVIQSRSGSGNGSEKNRVVSLVGAAAAWIVVFVLFFTVGNRGFYGDRLFVIFKEQADTSSIRSITDIDARRTAAYETLTKQADVSQAGLRKVFDSVGVDYTSYYLVNAMEVRGGTLVRLFLVLRPEVDRVIPSPRLRPAPNVDAPSMEGGAQPPSDVVWNVKMIGADKVWSEFNVRGAGIVVGQSDSGADVSHPAIHDQYRGVTSGGDYNWFDPWNGTDTPFDDFGHGTHTLATVLGKDGVGIAPEATWFACANLNRNLANPALYLDCMQFMLAPFPLGGDPLKDGDPTKAADVLNNSWGCPELEGCDPEALVAAADHLRDAGIFVVVSAGNDGPNCSTINAPLSLYDSVFSVGAVDQSGTVAYFSSRGPVTADGSGRMKPDIVAPGVGVLSALPGNIYGYSDGTSMAGPHVAGAVTLLWSADPTLIGDIDRTEQILIDTAKPYTGDKSIGCFEGSNPNAAYGYGVLDVYAAVKEALGK